MKTPSLAALIIVLATILGPGLEPGRAEPASRARMERPRRPVLLYCLHYQAPGENRYAPTGTYSLILDHLRHHFDILVSDERPTRASLRGVAAVLIANPNDQPHERGPKPPHMNAEDIETFSRYVERGGGLLVMGNQENHNLEITDFNRLLARFGWQFCNEYTDFKKFTLPHNHPVLGGMRWGYYSGNRACETPTLPKGVQREAWVVNNPAIPNLKGDRSAPGALLATARVGRGRVVLATDSGWITNNILNGTGINGFFIPEHDNAEIMLRLVRWAAHR